jgi:hypothetical protein
MRGSSFFKAALLALALLVPVRAVWACPSCNEAVPANSGAEEDEQARLARAYNNSIYLMVGMPYFLLGVVGFMVYRGLKQRARLAPAPVPPPLPARAAQADGQGAHPCSVPSLDGAS